MKTNQKKYLSKNLEINEPQTQIPREVKDRYLTRIANNSFEEESYEELYQKKTFSLEEILSELSKR